MFFNLLSEWEGCTCKTQSVRPQLTSHQQFTVADDEVMMLSISFKIQTSKHFLAFQTE